MKKIVAGLVMVFMVCAAWAAEVPRSVWHAQVGDCVKDPALLRETIGKLSDADQKAFLGEVNEAIAAMPGSDEARAAAFLNANKAAVMGVASENRATMLAEVFATVPPEYLTVINEGFASSLLNRNANPSKPVSDATYQAIAVETMKLITERCATAENGGIRATFAAVMFERASGGTPTTLRQDLIATLPASVRESAGEWMAAAVSSENKESSYDGMLGAAGAGEEPNHTTVFDMAGPQIGVALLADMQVNGSTIQARQTSKIALTGPGMMGTSHGEDSVDQGLNRIPRGYVESKELLDEHGNPVPNPYYREDRGYKTQGYN